ncbi:endolytic transglycosylase MltG [Glaciecola sp. XM2]|uniref:endolytic transglycosylase MltG n=1 Tax=Glaciecola sp. XM2 TaxID=1914931 RepID=UPI001BDE37B6|nr:endolytic transglycosylase MltG [Glaciecola sp. XM2]MBT1449557.1 endolytic transglycosylase MltG [Glaciecola sp. XM2]
MIKKILITFVIGFLCAVGGAAYVYKQVTGLSSAQLDIQSPLIIQVSKGQTAQQIKQMLPMQPTELDIVYFKLWLRMYPQYANIKTGYYEFTTAQTLGDVFSRISRGEETQFSVSLVEGLTIKEWYTQLSQVNTLTQDLPNIDSLYDTLVNQDTSFCVNELRSIEGCLLADTYFFVYGDSALSILQRAYRAMDKTLDSMWAERFLDIPLKTPYEALILASIIEKETAVAAERGVIAGVFSNRLELGMRLQTDPTVIYGIGDAFDGNITRAHLREKTLFNTYRIDGLPPTPIAMAGPPSLRAAVQPELTDYIYFVAKGDGSHQFSVTLAEHNQAVATYQLNR